jgi:hypothetical protein
MASFWGFAPFIYEKKKFASFLRQKDKTLQKK